MFRRREKQAELEEVKASVHEDLIALGDGVRALDVSVELDTTPQEAKDAYARSLSAYERGESQWKRARTPDALRPVGELLESGRYDLTVAKALIDGRRPPERRPPCFFDPRHGPSSRDVEWAPPYGQSRPVPSCEADAVRLESGEDPQVRRVLVRGASMPYYNAGSAYAPFAGGYFDGFDGGRLLPGLLVGTVLGGGIGSVYGGFGGFFAGFYNHRGGDSMGSGSDTGGGDSGGGGDC